MKICVIGTGYVGLVSGACLAEMGNDVICVDRDEERIAQLREGVVPIYEPGLEEIVHTNIAEERLRFTTDLAEAVRETVVCFIAVGTPQSTDGSADLSAVFGVASDIARLMDGYRVIATKSTVPVGTAAKIRNLVAENTKHPFSVVSNPEFLKQGSAVDDFLKPERVVVGVEDQRAFDIMQELYAPFLRTGNPIITMDILSAEMTKYVANAFLATKISFINEMANLCERVGADIAQVRTGICTDSRIGKHFLFPGVGYGGSCLPKDVQALLKTAGEHECECPIIDSVHRVNQRQRERFVGKVLVHFGGNLAGKKIAVWGLAFKPRTDDMREAPSVTVIQTLLEAGAEVRAFDPKAYPAARALLGDRVRYFDNYYTALEGSDALIIMTEWNEFRRPNFERIKNLMAQPVIFDGRNLYDVERMQERGFVYYAVGRPQPGTTLSTRPSSFAARARL
ncbi:MAG: UDP-glucose/GDP-mannose dehydrogenase family protein [Armatimonadetes bacterium]|nr:UDP-glucose/GDP-mannose dehydrogenase family protein [Armatimonadota bacterium]